MSNETVIRVTGDAEGYVSEMDRARKSGIDFIASQETMRQRVATAAAAVDASRKALKEQGDEALAAFNKQARSAESWLTALQKQAAQAGKTRSELMELRAAELGVSDAATPFIEKIRAAEDAMRNGSKEAHGLNFATAGARRELLVLAHEASQGSWKNFGGSLLVLGERTDALSMLMNKTALSIGAMVAVLAIAAHAVVKAGEELAVYGDQVEQLHQKTGLATDSIQQWAFATKTVGIESKESTKMLADLGDAQNKAVHGNKDAAAAFKAIGVSLEDLKRSSPEDLLPRIADAFHDSADGAAKAAVANELFGSSGADLIPLLDRGAKGLEALNAAAAESGAIIGGDTIKQMAALREHMELSKAKMDALTLSAKAQLLPTILNLTDAMSGNAAMKPLLEDFYKGIGLIVKGAASAVATLVVGFQQLAESIATAWTVVGLATQGEFRLAGIAAEKGYENLKRQGDGYVQFMQKLWSDTAMPAPESGAVGTKPLNFAKGNNGPQHEKAYHDDEATRFLQQLRDKDAAIRAEIESTGKKMTEAEKQQAEFLQKIADLKEKKILTADQKSLLTNQDAIKAQLAQNVADERRLQLKQDVLKLEERSAQLNAQIANYQQSQREQYSRQLDAVGMGSEAQKNAQAVKSIYREYEKLMADLDKATPKSQIGGEAYLAEREKIREGLRQSLQDYQDYYTTLKDKQADWTNGATEAIQNYVDASRNKMAEAASVVTSAFKGMEDALTNFVMTGKLNFKSLADSIISEIVRIQMRQAAAGLAGLLGGLFGAALSPGVGAFGGAGAAAGSGTVPVAGDLLGGGSMAAPTYGGGIFSVAGARASGGPVDAGKTYLVGENGPELWTPSQSGSIVPNHELGGGGTVVNVQLVEDSSKAGQVEQKQTGSGVDLVAYVTQIAKRAVAGDLASGQGDISKALGQRYGLTPRFR
ncbi:phage tail tape measure protein [Ralstonia insidiosa]|uniref:Phage tail tape measure protein n=1 Tax=Ralstonia insidiosa TaxID=190721 RepID=A0A848NW75_9RALS|nr:phage tail tape measure protein [Ralstonia insidiosa]